MIIVGDPFTLKTDDNWKHVITYIEDNKGMIRMQQQQRRGRKKNTKLQ